MKKTKAQKGITLIALIITIVVLLILAVVAIKAVQGDGIIRKAKEATNNYTVAQEKEQIALGYQNYQLDKVNNANATLKVDSANVEGSETKGWIVTFAETKNQYTLSANGTFNDKKLTEEEKYNIKYAKLIENALKYGVVENNVYSLKSEYKTQWDYAKGEYVPQIPQGTEIAIPFGVTDLSSGSDLGPKNLKNVVIPSTVVVNDEWPDYSFFLMNETSVETVTIYKGINLIWNTCFGGCSSLTKIIYTGTKAEWEEIARLDESNYDYQDDRTRSVTVSCVDGDTEFLIPVN